MFSSIKCYFARPLKNFADTSHSTKGNFEKVFFGYKSIIEFYFS